MAETSRLAPRDLPIAEIARRVGRAAELHGFARPSYEQVRVLVHDARRRAEQPTVLDVAVDVAFRARSPEAIVDQLSGIGVPRVRR